MTFSFGKRNFIENIQNFIFIQIKYFLKTCLFSKLNDKNNENDKNENKKLRSKVIRLETEMVSNYVIVKGLNYNKDMKNWESFLFMH